MQMKKKSVLTFVAGCSLIASLALPISSTSVFAGEISRTNPVGFGYAWERYASGDSGRASLTYGFNTSWIDEDYAHARHATKQHRAKVLNGRGTHFGDPVPSGSLSRADVVHNGSSITYKNTW